MSGATVSWPRARSSGTSGSQQAPSCQSPWSRQKVATARGLSGTRSPQQWTLSGRGPTTYVPLQSRPPAEHGTGQMDQPAGTHGSSLPSLFIPLRKGSRMRLTRTQLTTAAVTASIALTGAATASASGGSTAGGGGGTATSQTPKVDSIKV